MIIKEATKLNDVKEYYFSKKLQQITEMNKSDTEIINLGIGSPDLSPSSETIGALYKSALNKNNHGYQSYKGLPQLREAISEWLKNTYNIDIDYNTEILPLIGSKEGIMHISMSFLNHGDEVLVPNPGYPTYSSVSKLAGAKIRYYDLEESKNWAINIDKLSNQNLSKVKIMWINYPNMPTGAKANTKLFEQLIKLAKKEKFLIINDNPYSLILNDKPESILSIDGAKDVALELNSLSKSHNMAGWRIGWVSGNKDYINTIIKFKSNMDSGMFKPIQEAAIQALQNNDDWHKEQNKKYALRRNYVHQIFDILNCKYNENQAGMFVWAKVPNSIIDTEEFVENILQKAKVFITPGFIFGSNGQKYIRISLCSKIPTLKKAKEQISNFMNDFK